MSNAITSHEKAIIRQLAQKQRAIAELPIMKARRLLWYDHNDCHGQIPLVTFDSASCLDELLPSLACSSPLAREIESHLRINLVNHEMIDDDRVLDATYNIPWLLDFRLFDLKVDKQFIPDADGRNIGHRFYHPIIDLHQDRVSLRASTFSADLEATRRKQALVQDILGDILDVKISSDSLAAYLSRDLVHLMGMEAMLYALVDYPDDLHELMRQATDDYLAYFHWLETNRLLVLNTGNDAIGKGTYGFSRISGPLEIIPEAGIRLNQMWGCMDSQETIGISPDMFGEFFFPFYQEIAALFGLVYYGCCEPVHPIWDKYVSKLPNLRKVAISPWCDERYMGQVLAGRQVVYHRKPSPNLFSASYDLDEAALEKSILHTLMCAKGCHLEITFRDVITLQGNREKPKAAVAMTRKLLSEHWGK